MKLVINGDEKQVTDDMTVSQLLVEENVKIPDMVSVELNGRILKKTAYDGTILEDGDNVQLVYFMGGGSIVSLNTDGTGAQSRGTLALD